MPDDDGLTFDGYPQPPTVPPDPVGDEWRGEAGPAGPAGPTGATGATGPAGAPGGVTTFNTRTGAVVLLSADVTSALTFTPYDAANPSGYQTAANVTTKLAAPGPIGGTTPGTGAFTTLSATSTISGAGFTSWLASPPAIGGTAPAAGAFTTLSATSTISGTGFSNWLASPPAIGGTTAAAGTFSALAVAGTAGSFRNVDFRSGASLRMRLSLNNTAEGGANAGSDLDLFTFTDAGGALLSPAIRVTRSTGAVQFFAPLTVTSLTASSTITPNQTAGVVGTNTNNSAQAGSVGEVISAVVLTGAAVALTTGVCANVTSISLTAGDWDVTGTVGLNVGGTTVVQSVQSGISTTSATMPGFSTMGGATQLIGASFATGFPVGLGTGTARLSLASTTTVYLLATVGFTTSTAAAYGVIWARRAR
jgi:hypothetical protein